MNFELFEGNPDKPATHTLMDFQNKIESKKGVTGVVETPLTKQQKTERFIQVLSPAKNWQTVERVLCPEIRFALDHNLPDGQEIEISPMC